MSIVLKLEANANVTAPDSAHSTLYVTDSGQLVLKNTSNAVQVFSTNSYGNTEVAAFLPTYTGNMCSLSNIIASGYIYANNGIVSSCQFIGPLSTAAQPNITSVGTLTALSVTGNITTANYFVGNGAYLTGLPAGYANSDVAAYLCSDTVTTNITTSANVIGANIGNATSNIYGNAAHLTCIAGANVTGTVASATVAASANSVAGANVSGTVASATVAASANAVAGANVSGAVAYATTANSVAGANVSGTVSSATTAGTVTTAAQGNITSVGTLTSLSVSGTATVGNVSTAGNVSAAGNITGSYHIGNGSSLTCLTGANVTGAVAFATTANAVAGANVSGTVANATYAVCAGTVTTAAQPNITSTGTLTSLSVSGTATAGNVNTGGVVSATGNITGANLITAGNLSAANASLSGNITVGSGSGGNISNANVITANTLVLAGNISNANVTSTITLSASGNVYGGNVSVTGNVTGNGLYISNNATILGNLTVQGNVTFTCSNVIVTNDLYVALANNQSTFANVNGSGLQVGNTGSCYVTNWTYSSAANVWATNVGISAAGNVSGANVLTGGIVSATGNICGANVTTGGIMSSTGNATHGNINTGGIVSATGNICGSYFIGNGSCLTGLSTTSIANGTSNVCVTGSGGNVAIGVGGNANIILATGTGANITGYLNTSGNTQLASLGVGTAASGTSGEIRATNNITAYYSSDKRFKENVQDIPGALDKVSAIGGKTFDWSDEYIAQQGGEDGYFVQKSDFGVIAQDVQAVFPLAVRTREDGTLAVDYEKLVALAFAAIVELKAEIASLKK